MDRKLTRRNKRTPQPRDRLLGRFATSILYAGKSPQAEVFRLKTTVSAEDLFAIYPRLFKTPTVLEHLYGPAFPASVDELFAKQAYGASHLLNEIVWAVCRSLDYADRLRSFVELRSRFERSVLENDKEQCHRVLAAVEQQFGQSMWLIQSKIAVAFHWDGLEESRRLVRSIAAQLKANSITGFLLHFIGKRTEATQRKEYLKEELGRYLSDMQGGYEEFRSYLFAKIFEMHNIAVQDAAATLVFEPQSSLIDHYEALVSILQSASVHDAFSASASEIFAKPISTLLRRIEDPRLIGVARSLGIVVAEKFDPARAEIIEAYTAGCYDRVIHASQAYLSASPDDIAVLVLQVRACIHAKQPLPSYTGVRAEIAGRLSELLGASSGAYQAAFALVTLADRFYAQSWIQYVRAVALHELRTEQPEYPSTFLRRLYVLDSRASPFSAVAATGAARASLTQGHQMMSLYPLTLQVYRAASRGIADESADIAEARLRKYLARHSLSVGDAGRAAQNFEWLIENSDGSEQLRAGGGGALCYLKLGMPDRAVETLVDSYIRKSSMPSVLPIEAVSAAMEDPSSWPPSICVPLLLELFTTFCDEGAIPRLRYAFEYFLLKNGITEPAALVEHSKDFGVDRVVAFLDRVWRPEVMRQTLIYGGTREIEEARIRVCKALVELDEGNAARHLDEIKERVKQQEIAKGTRLIEQSKVHVDTDAIRRSLRKKMGDSYARYRSSAQPPAGKVDQVLTVVSEAMGSSPSMKNTSLAKVLSKVHVLDSEPLSESDVQFAALFSEVTNEFLRGDHGLNAYLSTCVRHGTLSNTMRKAVADERIVTARQTNGTYLRNTHWLPSQDEATQQSWLPVLDALEKFATRFDSIIDHVKDDLLQIRIVGIDSEKDKALFQYATSNLERWYVQKLDRNMSMDGFVSYCIDILWGKTDDNLHVVQDVLNTTVRQSISHAFEVLEGSLRLHSDVLGVGELINSVGRARTSTQNKLGTVISWFKRSEVYDRQDYSADFPAHVALNMIRNTISSADRWSSVSTHVSPEGSFLPGRTLDAMVYILYDLFANALLRSGLEPEVLELVVDISVSNGRVRCKVANNIDPQLDTESARERIRLHRDSVLRSDAGSRAQSETNSGLYKVWMALSAPIYGEPSFDFFMSDGKFIVELGFSLPKGGTYEGTFN